MPLCCIQALPGTIFSLTDALTVVVPQLHEEDLSPFPSSKDVREGRVSFHTESTQAEESAFSFDVLAETCKRWRERGIFSFVEVSIRQPIGASEKALLKRLKEIVDWLIVDATSFEQGSFEVLSFEQWGIIANSMKEIGGKVGLHLRIDDRMPLRCNFPWIAKAVLELSQPGFVFVEASSEEAIGSLVQGVQDILYRHPLSKDGARIVPILRSSFHSLEQTSFEVFDFKTLDALLIESRRPFFGGVAIRQERKKGLFSVSLWQAMVAMLVDQCSSSSFVVHSVDVLREICPNYRMPLVEAMCRLISALTQKDQQEIMTCKTALEKTWEMISKDYVRWSVEMVSLKTAVAALGKESSEALMVLRRK